MSRVLLPSDQEDRANEALGALEGLHDLLVGRDPMQTIQAEPLAYLLKLCIYSAQRAIPDGHPRHRRAVNDIEGV